jgi:prepilin-type processing-associated H-X9-DG protein/prepilin-type N-terminal cleavage/methylation domain-containing protein
MRRDSNCKTAGYSLLELLISIVIITLLAALIWPALGQARGAARRTMCQSNLRQWALAAQLYADLHAGRLPYRGQGIQPTTRLDKADDWFNALPLHMESMPYIDLVRAGTRPMAGAASVWVCPDAQRTEYPTQPTFFAYAMNMALSTPFMGRPDHIEKVGPTQTMAFMADSLGPYCSTLPSTEDYTPIARHVGNTVNIAFLDGHVGSYNGEEVGCRIGDPKRPDIRWYPTGTKWPGPPK